MACYRRWPICCPKPSTNKTKRYWPSRRRVMHPKITSEHLGRGAIVYIRQSTMGQVAEHTESQRRQYALAHSARTYGFSSGTVIDGAICRSGSGLVAAPGLPQLVA